MNKQKIFNELINNLGDTGLVIDDNKDWKIPEKYSRINQFIDGDLHDFYDLIGDEELFAKLNDSFDWIMIGEIFHVINLQTVVYNLENSLNCLNESGAIIISINHNCDLKMEASYSKVINRLKLIDGFEEVESYQYSDQNEEEWTLLCLKKQVVDETNFKYTDAVVIGHQISDLINKGKNPSKLKTGFLMSKSALSNEQFKASYLSFDENVSLYVQEQIKELKPCFKQQFFNDLHSFVKSNKQVLDYLKQDDGFKAGCFNLALQSYQQTSLTQDDKCIAKNAELINFIWDNKIKSRDKQIKDLIEKMEE